MPRAKLSAADKLEDGELYKYVRLKSGEIRLAKFDGFGPDHCDMVTEHEIETVVSAGTIVWMASVWSYTGYGSQTCNAPWLKEDNELLTQLLGIPLRLDY